MRRRTDSEDTSPAAHKRYIDYLRKMSPMEKIARVLELTDQMRSSKTRDELWSIASKHDSEKY